MYFAYLRSEESVLYRPHPVLKRCTSMYDYIINSSTTELAQPSLLFHVYSRLPSFFDLIQPPCGPGAFTLAEKETWKITKYSGVVKIQRQQAAANNPRVVFVWKNQPKKGGKKTYSVVQEQVWVSRCLVRITWRTTSTTNHEQTWGGACCKRPWQRGTDASLTCFFGLVTTCDVRGTCPTQYKYS